MICLEPNPPASQWNGVITLPAYMQLSTKDVVKTLIYIVKMCNDIMTVHKVE